MVASSLHFARAKQMMRTSGLSLTKGTECSISGTVLNKPQNATYMQNLAMNESAREAVCTGLPFQHVARSTCFLSAGSSMREVLISCRFFVSPRSYEKLRKNFSLYRGRFPEPSESGAKGSNAVRDFSLPPKEMQNESRCCSFRKGRNKRCYTAATAPRLVPCDSFVF